MKEKLDLKTKVRAWARGQKVVNPQPELVLYINCKNWNCLPDNGGWYDQSPYICYMFSLIDAFVSEVENEKAKKIQSKMKKK